MNNPTASDLIFDEFRKQFDYPAIRCIVYENSMVFNITNDYDSQKRLLNYVEEVISTHSLPLVAKINRGLPTYRGTLVISYVNPVPAKVFEKNNHLQLKQII